MSAYEMVNGELKELPLGELMTCSCCGQEVFVPFTERDEDGFIRRFVMGERILIQDALPDVPDEYRELFLSGTCPDCWRKLFDGGWM